MREKKEYVLFTFHTTTEALAMERYCLDRGIGGRLIPVPGEVSAGCGLAWRMTEDEHENVKSQFAEIRYDRLVRIWM